MLAPDMAYLFETEEHAAIRATARRFAQAHIAPHGAEWEEAERSFVVLAGLGWRILMDAIEEARALVPEEQWLDVRLEDFMDDPRGRTEEVLDFLGLEWTPQYEAGFAKHTFQASRGVAWKRDLSEADIAALERTIAKPLAAYGYDLSQSAHGTL